MNEKVVNKLYDDLMNSTEAVINTTDNPAMNDEDLNMVDVDTSSPVLESDDPDIVMGVQNGDTGVTASTNTTNIEEIKKLSELNYQRFISKSTDTIDTSVFSKILDKETMENVDNINIVSSMIKRRLNGEKFSAYNAFPDIIKDKIKDMAIQSGQPINKTTLDFIGNIIFSDMVKNYKSLIPSEQYVDIDSMLMGYNEGIQNIYDKGTQELSVNRMTILDEKKAEIDASIERAKSENNEDAIKELTLMKEGLEDAYTLNKFSEAIKSIKIKKFDLEKPDRVYSIFYTKYENHRYNISDIKSCPSILSRHLKDIPEKELLKFCLCFCKYIQNMSPNNIAEHAFMYYFIRNIYLLDSLNPRGGLYESLTGKEKDFYDSFTSAIRIAINNMKK